MRGGRLFAVRALNFLTAFTYIGSAFMIYRDLQTYHCHQISHVTRDRSLNFGLCRRINNL